MKELELERLELDNINSPMNKKIRRVVEAIIMQHEEEFAGRFTEEEMLYVLKHKAQIAKLAVEDEQLKNLLKEEVEDCIGAFLVRKNQ